MAYTWPAAPTLPQSPQKGYTEDIGANLVKTPMDSGPAKVRKRGAKPTVLNMTFLMTTAQVNNLNTFLTTISYTARFNFTHPRTSTQVECRIVPQGEGTMYTSTYQAPGYYNISMVFEVMP